MTEVILFLIVLAIILLLIAQLAAATTPKPLPVQSPGLAGDRRSGLVIVLTDARIAVCHDPNPTAYQAADFRPVEALNDPGSGVYEIRLSGTGNERGSAAYQIPCTCASQPVPVQGWSYADDPRPAMTYRQVQSKYELPGHIEFHERSGSRAEYVLLPAERIPLSQPRHDYHTEAVNAAPSRGALPAVRGSRVDFWS